MGFSLFTKPCTLNLINMKYPCPQHHNMTACTECIQTHATLELRCSGKLALPHYSSTLDLLSRSWKVNLIAFDVWTLLQELNATSPKLWRPFLTMTKIHFVFSTNRKLLHVPLFTRRKTLAHKEAVMSYFTIKWLWNFVSYFEIVCNSSHEMSISQTMHMQKWVWLVLEEHPIVFLTCQESLLLKGLTKNIISIKPVFYHFMPEAVLQDRGRLPFLTQHRCLKKKVSWG